MTKRLVFDIETVGCDFDSLDEYSKQTLLKTTKKESQTEEQYNKAVEDIKNGLGLSPLTGEIVAIGVLDCTQEKGAVYFQTPGQNIEELTEGGIRFISISEEEMLKKFWELAYKSSELISFNGRRFDVPFLNLRSAIYKIKPSCDLMHYKYINNGKPNYAYPIHVDLYDLLTFHREFYTNGMNLHMFCKAFGIKSPKDGQIDGNGVASLYKEGRYLDIAKYNTGDLLATRELYNYWDQYLRIGNKS